MGLGFARCQKEEKREVIAGLTLSIFFEIVPFPPPGGPMMRVVISDLRATLCSAATVSDFALHVSGVVAGSRGRTIVEWNQWGLIQHCDKRI